MCQEIVKKKMTKDLKTYHKASIIKTVCINIEINKPVQ